jgi:hypothetical protein
VDRPFVDRARLAAHEEAARGHLDTRGADGVVRPSQGRRGSDVIAAKKCEAANDRYD